jgi:hypothetical protein
LLARAKRGYQTPDKAVETSVLLQINARWRSAVNWGLQQPGFPTIWGATALLIRLHEQRLSS